MSNDTTPKSGPKPGTPTSPKTLTRSVRMALLANPEALTQDSELLAAIALDTPLAGEGLVDIRHITIERQKEALARLEEQHSAVVSAAFENTRAMKRIQDAVLALLAASTKSEWEQSLARELPHILRIKSARLATWNKKHRRIELSGQNGGSRALIPIAEGLAIELRSDSATDFTRDSGTDYLEFLQSSQELWFERLSE